MLPRIIDSHVHIFDTCHLQQLKWMTPGHLLNAPHPPSVYAASITTPISGYIFIEADHAYPTPLAAETLAHPLEELEYAFSLRNHHPPLLGIVPFAPVPLGSRGMDAWWAQVSPEASQMVKGVRYLVQDKPHGTMLKPDFVDGVRWVLRRGWAFDLGIDLRSAGKWQGEEAVKMLEAVYSDEDLEERGWIVVSKFTSFLAPTLLSRCLG